MMPNEEEIQNENIEEEKVEVEANAEPSKKDKKKIAKLEEDLEKAKADVEHWKNEYYRAYADTKNLRSKLEKDYRESLKYRVEGFVENLLPILDSFNSVLANEPSDPALKNYLIGFQYIYRNLVGVLENEGIKEISPKVGDKFNSANMNAVDTTEGEKDNIITKVYSNGYQLHDHLIKPAMVQVSKVKVEENKEENKDQAKTDA